MFFQRTLWKIFAHLVNCIAKLLPPDPISNRLRPLLYRLIGLRCRLSTTISALSYLHPGRLVIGHDTFINQGVFFDLTSPVTIGNQVAVGLQATFITANHTIGSPERRCGPHYGRPIFVEDGVWIGARATILGGVTIGRGSVVAAGALVNRDVPSNTLVAGVPAKVIRVLDEQS